MVARRSVVLVAALVASAVTFSTANAAQPGWETSPVYAKWQALGGAAFAGDKVGDEVVLNNGIRYAKFLKNDVVITWREAAGAHWFSGAIARYWLYSGGTAGQSAATMDQVPVSRGAQAGAAVAFDANYSVYYSDAYGAYPIAGASRDKYWANGSVTGRFGWPVSRANEILGTEGGTEQHFSEAVSLYQQPGRPEPFWISGALREKYRQEGGPGGNTGRWRWLSSDQTAEQGNGWSAAFDVGTIYWSAATGARWIAPSTDGTFRGNGGPGGPFGYPNKDTIDVSSGEVTDFVNYTSVYRGPLTERGYWINDPMRAEYVRNGGPGSPFGWPKTNPTPAPGTDGKYVLFSQALDKVILSGPRTGTHTVLPEVLSELRSGGDVAVYGLPQTGLLTVGTRPFQQFEHATVWVGDEGRYTLTLGWTWRDIWWRLGGTQSALGLPTSRVYGVPNVINRMRQDFENGWIVHYTDVDEWYWGTGQAAADLSLDQARKSGTKIAMTTYGPRR